MRSTYLSKSTHLSVKSETQKEVLSVSELLLLQKEVSWQTLDERIELSEKYDLSKMTMDEISKEVNATRKSR
jgi:hypothetical protein